MMVKSNHMRRVLVSLINRGVYDVCTIQYILVSPGRSFRCDQYLHVSCSIFFVFVRYIQKASIFGREFSIKISDFNSQKPRIHNAARSFKPAALRSVFLKVVMVADAPTLDTRPSYHPTVPRNPRTVSRSSMYLKSRQPLGLEIENFALLSKVH